MLSAAAVVAAASLMLTACSKSIDETPSAAESTAASSESASDAAPEATEEPAADAGEEDATLAAIREANQLDDVLADCGKISVVSTYTNADGSIAYIDKNIFQSTDNGLEFRQDVQVNDTTGITTEDGPSSDEKPEENHTYTVYKAVGDAPFAGYITNSDDHTLMLVDPDLIDELLGYYYVPTAYGTETVTETGEQDGILMVVVDNTDEGNKVGETVYCVDPETKRLVAINQSYIMEDGTTAGTQNYQFTYGDDVDVNAVADVSDEIVNAADTCKVTAIFHPGKSNEFTANYVAAKGTYVAAFGGEGAAYLDAGLSDPAYGLTLDNDELTVYVK